MNNTNDLDDQSCNDTLGNQAADLEASHEAAEKEIIESLLADVRVKLADGQTWSLEELLLERLNLTPEELDFYINDQKESF